MDNQSDFKSVSELLKWGSAKMFQSVKILTALDKSTGASSLSKSRSLYLYQVQETKTYGLLRSP